MRYTIENQSFEIYQVYEGNRFVLYTVSSLKLRNEKLSSFKASDDLFYYNNEYIFSSYSSNKVNYNLYVSNNISNNNLITFF